MFSIFEYVILFFPNIAILGDSWSTTRRNQANQANQDLKILLGFGEMKNEDSIGLIRLYLRRKSVPNVQDNLTTKKTPQQTKILGKQQSNTLKRLLNGKSVWLRKIESLMCKVHRMGRLAPRISRHMLKVHSPRHHAHEYFREKKWLFVTFSSLKPIILAQVRWKLFL